jgi:dTDP-4-amino-4,6-dideoxygalactose transaminase
MITTGDATLAAHLRLLRVHGMSHSAHHRHAAAEVTFERYEVPGFNHRLSDISAAIGRVQLGRLTFQVARRRELACDYHRGLHHIPRVGFPGEPWWSRGNWQSYRL